MRHQLQPKKTEVRRIIHLYNSKRHFISPSLLTRQLECFGFKSGCVVQVENDKMRRHAVTAKEDRGKAVLFAYITAKNHVPALLY